MMEFIDALTNPNPEPGQLLQSLKSDVSEGRRLPEIETLKEQRSVANAKLSSFLSNVSDSPGSRKVVREFYREEHGIEIDATDADELRREIPDIESIVQGDALPVVTKEELRDRYGVEGAYDKKKDTGEHCLVPDWVRKNNDEPYLMNSTGGTTGEPWGRAMTRNDTAIIMACCIRMAKRILDNYGINASELRIANPWPHPASKRFITESVSLMEMQVEEFKHELLMSGGEEGAEEVNTLVNYLNGGEYSLIVYPISYIYQGGLGVRIRRGDVDVDILFNAGAPFSEKRRWELESEGYRVMDMYGETEYPELAPEREVDGVRGYDMPLNAQINLVYDPETEELSYEGSGRLSYFSYALEGQVVPGVYVSGIRGSVDKIGNGRQILHDVERATGSDGGCS